MTDEELAKLRTEMYEVHLKARFEQYAKDQQRRKEEEEEDEEDEEDDGPGGECQACENMAPDIYCKTCSMFLCGMCASAGKNGHEKGKHKTCSVDAGIKLVEAEADDE